MEQMLTTDRSNYPFFTKILTEGIYITIIIKNRYLIIEVKLLYYFFIKRE